jgi:predicted DNA-binding ribbon-helix-helix protein
MGDGTTLDTFREAGFQAAEAGGLTIGNVMVAGRRTSMRLEPPMWRWLDEVAAAHGMTVGQFCTEVARAKPRGSSLTAAIRVAIAAHYRVMARRTDGGQQRRRPSAA